MPILARPASPSLPCPPPGSAEAPGIKVDMATVSASHSSDPSPPNA